jgi:hypothetical protein
MRRRDFFKVIAGSAAFRSLAARAQERGIYRLGFLVPPPRTAPAVSAFFDELRQNGFAEGDNLTIIPGGFEVTDDHLAEQAAALINAAPDAIVAGPELPLQALQALTHTVPLVGMTESRRHQRQRPGRQKITSSYQLWDVHLNPPSCSLQRTSTQTTSRHR